VSEKLKKAASVALGLYFSTFYRRSERCAALAALAVHLDRADGVTGVKKAAAMAVALYLDGIRSHSPPIDARGVAVAALACHLTMEQRERRGAIRAATPVSAWAFKGFLMRQAPERKFG
jgi:hypothetical protein